MSEGTTPIDVSKHSFKNFYEARKWAKESIVNTYKNDDTEEDIYISISSIGKYLSSKAVQKSINQDIHLSVLTKLPLLVKTSMLKEVNQDIKGKNLNIKEIQRFYGIVNYEGKIYSVKITVKATKREGNKAYSYEVLEIENPALQQGYLSAGHSEASSNDVFPTAENLFSNLSE